jgi:hypothetical protein
MDRQISETTGLLRAWAGGDPGTLDRLAPHHWNHRGNHSRLFGVAGGRHHPAVLVTHHIPIREASLITKSSTNWHNRSGQLPAGLRTIPGWLSCLRPAAASWSYHQAPIVRNGRGPAGVRTFAPRGSGRRRARPSVVYHRLQEGRMSLSETLRVAGEIVDGNIGKHSLQLRHQLGHFWRIVAEGLRTYRAARSGRCVPAFR